MTQALIWLVIFIVSIIIELATMGLATIWFAGGALIALIFAICGTPLWLQITLFFVVSLVLIFFTRPIALKYFNNGRTKTNADSLVGEIAIVSEEIDNIKGQGVVKVNGLEWSAKTVSDEMVIPAGKKVIIQKIEGVKLIVIPESE